MHNYTFSEIPNNAEGQELVRLMRKYLNKDTYTLRVKGQYLKDGNDWRRYTYGQPISKSKCLRIYLTRHTVGNTYPKEG